MELKKFSPSQILISKHEAWAILKFFWPDLTLREEELTAEDINFAQGLLVEAVDASYKMGYAHVLFDVFYGFVDVRKMVKEFVKKAAKHWFKHALGKDLAKAEIYAAVRSTVAMNFRTAMAVRQQTGELTY